MVFTTTVVVFSGLVVVFSGLVVVFSGLEKLVFELFQGTSGTGDCGTGDTLNLVIPGVHTRPLVRRIVGHSQVWGRGHGRVHSIRFVAICVCTLRVDFQEQSSG